VAQSTRHEALSKVFTSLRLEGALAELGAEPAPQVFQQLEAMYGEPTRFYHTGQHVAECLMALDQYGVLAERPAEVEVAIWFHDAVYDSRRPDNEELSARLAADVLSSLPIAGEAVARIEAMILATRTHRADDRDTELLLDIDLGILGQHPDVFARYDDAIRREYAWVPEAQYRTGRAAVLKGFLDRPRIYATGAFRDLYETQARENLTSRLKALDPSWRA